MPHQTISSNSGKYIRFTNLNIHDLAEGKYFFDRNSGWRCGWNSDRNSVRKSDKNSDRNSDWNSDRNSGRNSDRKSDRKSERNTEQKSWRIRKQTTSEFFKNSNWNSNKKMRCLSLLSTIVSVSMQYCNIIFAKLLEVCLTKTQPFFILSSIKKA